MNPEPRHEKLDEFEKKHRRAVGSIAHHVVQYRSAVEQQGPPNKNYRQVFGLPHFKTMKNDQPETVEAIWNLNQDLYDGIFSDPELEDQNIIFDPSGTEVYDDPDTVEVNGQWVTDRIFITSMLSGEASVVSHLFVTKDNLIMGGGWFQLWVPAEAIRKYIDSKHLSKKI